LRQEGLHTTGAGRHLYDFIVPKVSHDALAVSRDRRNIVCEYVGGCYSRGSLDETRPPCAEDSCDWTAEPGGRDCAATNPGWPGCAHRFSMSVQTARGRIGQSAGSLHHGRVSSTQH
jgi:hypothetical protein